MPPAPSAGQLAQSPPAWLAERLGKPDTVIVAVDGSYYLPTQKRDARG